LPPSIRGRRIRKVSSPVDQIDGVVAELGDCQVTPLEVDGQVVNPAGHAIEQDRRLEDEWLARLRVRFGDDPPARSAKVSAAGFRRMAIAGLSSLLP
jgi:hypothetical protein